MLFDEFMAGTGCKGTDYNYQIYKRLEILYMNDDTITKEEIYEYGKRLVDNRLTEDEITWNKHIDEDIKAKKQAIYGFKNDIGRYMANLNYFKEVGCTKEDIKFWNTCIKEAGDDIKRLKAEIRDLRTLKYR